MGGFNKGGFLNGLWQHVATGLALRCQMLLADGKPISPDPHTRIHQGVMFSIDSSDDIYDAQVVNGASLDMVIIPSEGNYPHISIVYRLGGVGRILVYKLAETPTGGTAITPKNKKWDSDTVFGGTVLRNPTINMAGSELKEACMILGTQQGQSRTGSAGVFTDEIVVDGITLIRLKNDSGGTVTACLCINAYNASLIS